MTNKRSIEDDSQSEHVDNLNNLNNLSLNGEIDLKETILDLKWGVRNQIISNLYSHSSFLIQKIGDKLKEKHTKENYDLIQQLMNLPAANYETNRPKKRVKVDEDDARSNEIILDLSWCDRDLIVDNLMKNHHCAIMYSSKVSRAVKDNLTKENNRLVSILTNLQVRKIEEENEAVEEEEENVDLKGEEQLKEHTSVSTNVTRHNANKSQPIETESNKMDDEMKDGLQVVRQFGKFLPLMPVLEELSQRDKSDITFSFKVPFSKLENKKLDDKKSPFFSPPFLFNGIQWSVKVQVKTKEFVDYLQVFLQPVMKCDSFEVTAEFKLVNEDKLSTVKKDFKYTFCKLMPAGFTDFIETSALEEPNSGFVDENGEIELEIHLKAANKPIVEI